MSEFGIMFLCCFQKRLTELVLHIVSLFLNEASKNNTVASQRRQDHGYVLELTADFVLMVALGEL